MDFGDFSRRHASRPSQLMWFLGAGISAGAGIPTAGQIISDLKQILYSTQKRVNRNIVADLTNPSIRALLQDFVDSLGSLPKAGAPDEYSKLFEAAYPAEADRRTYIEEKIRGAKPSYGHIALAILLKAQHTQIVWTTNFDPLLADACVAVFGSTGNLKTIDIGSAKRVSEALSAARWPLEIKLHGDFRWNELKNTTDELKAQDQDMRAGLVEACKTRGMIIAGYSGHDESVMKTLHEALNQPNAFPHGLFWLHRGDDEPYEGVAALLDAAKTKNIECALIRIENFDEALADMVQAMPNLNLSPLASFGLERDTKTPAPKPVGKQGLPGLRLNGISIDQMPTQLRKVDCSIGNAREVSDAIIKSGANVIAARTKHGVLGFGSDAEFKKAFDPFSIKNFSTHAIEARRLRYDSHERGLIRRALSFAIARNTELELLQQRNTDLFFPKNPTDKKWEPLRQLVGPLRGHVPDHPELVWNEGLGIRVEWANSILWALLDPRTILAGVTPENQFVGASFIRERGVRRYNSQMNQLMRFWAIIISSSDAEQKSFGCADGIDAAFKIGSKFGISWRLSI